MWEVSPKKKQPNSSISCLLKNMRQARTSSVLVVSPSSARVQKEGQFVKNVVMRSFICRGVFIQKKRQMKSAKGIGFRNVLPIIVMQFAKNGHMKNFFARNGTDLTNLVIGSKFAQRVQVHTNLMASWFHLRLLLSM